MSCTSPCRLPPRPRRDRGALLGAALILAVSFALSLAGCATRRSAGGPEQAAPLMIEVPDVDLDAEVFVDGNYVGQVKALRVPETGPILLAPGIHRVEVRKPGRFPVQRTVTVDKAQRTAVVVRAELLEDPS
jgi:hypothetical protein